MPFLKGHKLGIGNTWNRGRKRTEEQKKKISLTLKGRMPKNIDLIKGWNRGIIKPRSKCLDCGKILTKRKSKYCKKHMTAGIRNYQWKNDSGKSNRTLKTSGKYKQWRKKVIDLNGYVCRLCNEINGKFEVDHLFPWSIFPELRFNIDNGRILCHQCHRMVTSIQNAKEENKEDFRNALFNSLRIKELEELKTN